MERKQNAISSASVSRLLSNAEIIIIFLTLLSFAISLFYYSILPESMASHWNQYGQADGYMDKFWGIFLMPIVLVFTVIIFILIPKIDPMKKNIALFRKYFDTFIILFFALMFLVFLHILSWNLGYHVNPNQIYPLLFAGLIYYIGVLCEHSKRNWTLSSDIVWDKTHKLAGKLFKLSAVISLLGLFFGSFAILFLIIPVSISALYTVVYSYLVFRKLNHRSKH